MIWLKEKKDMHEKKEQPQFTQEGLEAIEGSMEKWHGILYNGGSDSGPDDCPCCKRYRHPHNYLMCKGCPVVLYGAECSAVDMTGCCNTPYQFWKGSGADIGKPITTRVQWNAARDEFLFLAKVYFWYKGKLLDEQAKAAQDERLDALASMSEAAKHGATSAATWIGKSESKVRSLEYAHRRIDTLNNSTASHFQDVHRRLEDLENHMKQNSLCTTRCFKRLGSLRRTILNLAEILDVKVED